MKNYESCKTEKFVTDFHNKIFQFKSVLINYYSIDRETFYSSFQKQRHNQAMQSELYHKLNSCMVSLQCALSCASPIFVAY